MQQIHSSVLFLQTFFEHGSAANRGGTYFHMTRVRGYRTTYLIVIACLGICSATNAQEAVLDSYVLTGTVLTPTETIPSGAVSIRGNKITAVEPAGSGRSKTKVIDTAGIILPGLIDLHDHLSWNAFPRWKPNSEFGNRYEWQARTAYLTTLSAPHQELIDAGLACDLGRYAEIKAIVGGATSVVGTTADPCLKGLARNLDWYSGLYQKGALNQEKLAYQVFPLELLEKDPANPNPFGDANRVRDALANGTLKSFLIHLAEGKPNDAAAEREFRVLRGRGLLQPGVVVIHGVALSEADLREMKDHSLGFVWSPRSNIELYGSTANVALVKQLGIKIAIAPDWSPTGSSGMLDELRYASIWDYKTKATDELFSSSELIQMATSSAAELAGLKASLGTLAPGFYADILVIKPANGTRRSSTEPNQMVLTSRPVDVQLVIIGGIPTYGDPGLMAQLLPGKQLEKVMICGAEKALYFGTDIAEGITPRSWHDTEAALTQALLERGISLAPLGECNQ